AFANETDRPGVSAVMGYVSNDGDRLYTLDPAQQARLDADPEWTNEGRIFGAYDAPWPGLSPVYQFYDHVADRHIFSVDSHFDSRPGHKADNQGVAWYAALFIEPPPVPASPLSGGGSVQLVWLLGLALLW